MKSLEQRLIEDGKRVKSRVSSPQGLAEAIQKRLPADSSSTPIAVWALAAGLVLGIAIAVFLSSSPPAIESDGLSVDFSQVTDAEQLLAQELNHIESDLQSLQEQVSEELSFLF